MFKRYLISTIAFVCLMATLIPVPGQAETEEEAKLAKKQLLAENQAQRKAQRFESLQNYEVELAIAEVILRSRKPDEWTQEELEEYLHKAMFVIYEGILIYKMDHRQLPQGSSVLMNMDIIESWPLNPLNEWEPIRWGGEGFIPGNIIMQECPPELYTGLWNPKPMTFVMSINGSGVDYVPLIPLNYEISYWAILPAGSAFITGASTSPHSKSWQQYVERKNRAEAKSEVNEVAQP